MTLDSNTHEWMPEYLPFEPKVFLPSSDATGIGFTIYASRVRSVVQIEDQTRVSVVGLDGIYRKYTTTKHMTEVLILLAKAMSGAAECEKRGKAIPADTTWRFDQVALPAEQFHLNGIKADQIRETRARRDFLQSESDQLIALLPNEKESN